MTAKGRCFDQRVGMTDYSHSERSESEVEESQHAVIMYYVYIITNKNNSVLYIGMTNNLERRIYEHKSGLKEGFSKKYKLSDHHRSAGNTVPVGHQH